MGLFNRFKKDKKNQSPETTTPPNQDSWKFDLFSKYSEYLVIHIRNQQKNSYAPIAAYEDKTSGINGYLYLVEDMSYNLSAEEVINNMKTEFQSRLASNKIASYMIFYHGQINREGINPEEDGLNCILIEYQTESGQKGIYKMPYTWNNNELNYHSISDLSTEQTSKLVSTELKEGKISDYFQEQVQIKPQIETNAIGINIKKVNNGDFENTWGATLGFNTLQNEGRQMRMEHYAACVATNFINSENNYREFELNYDGVNFKAIETPEGKMFYPSISKQSSLPFVTKEIHEWDNFNKLVAVITGSGKDTFGLTFLATDYFKNAERYKETKQQEISLGGFGYVLDKYTSDSSDDPKFSEDFCAYMPHKGLAEFGWFDFIGEVRKVDHLQILENKSIAGNLIKIKLINNSEIPDFFNLDVFFCEENMRIQDIEVGIKITGMFQLTGNITE